jgi:hypothetical protein
MVLDDVVEQRCGHLAVVTPVLEDQGGDRPQM